MNSITPSIAGCLLCSYNSMKAVEETSSAEYTEDKITYRIYSKYVDGKKKIGLTLIESRPMARIVFFDVDNITNMHKVEYVPGCTYLVINFDQATLAIKIEKRV